MAFPKACSDTGLRGQGFRLAGLELRPQVQAESARAPCHLTPPRPRDQELLRDTQRSKVQLCPSRCGSVG